MINFTLCFAPVKSSSIAPDGTFLNGGYLTVLREWIVMEQISDTARHTGAHTDFITEV